MAMTPRRKRLVLFGSVLLGVAIAAGIATLAFRDNLQYFYNPSEVAAGKVPAGKRFRVGGMVPKGSIHRETGSLTVNFEIDEYTRWRLLEGLDDIGLTLRDEQAITDFENRREAWRPKTLPARS